uniref:Uncharacterized protein n=1 Tax=Romanomermis culicivorax TaxID=13658 RepID=A0A915KRB7_ROMCU
MKSIVTGLKNQVCMGPNSIARKIWQTELASSSKSSVKQFSQIHSSHPVGLKLLV